MAISAGENNGAGGEGIGLFGSIAPVPGFSDSVPSLLVTVLDGDSLVKTSVSI